MRTAVGLAAIKNGAILLVRKQAVWILPGGKPQKNEPDTACLVREILEELPGLTIDNFRFYGTFGGVTPHTKDIIELRVYFASTTGILMPSAEILDARWVNNPESYPLADATQKVIAALRADGHL